MSDVMDLVEDGYNEIAEPEHFDEILQGAVDTAGMESLSTAYTRAQIYLYGCLDASDTLSYKQRMAGMEGMVGDAFGSIWDFIKRVFKAVWGFFFGSGDDTVEAEVEKSEKKVKGNKEALQTAGKKGKSEEQSDKIIKSAKKTAEKIKNDPKSTAASKKSAEKIIADAMLTAAKKASEKEVTADQMLSTLAKINDVQRALIIKRVGAAENLRKQFSEHVEKNRAKELGNTRFKGMYEEFQKQLKNGGFGNSIPSLVSVDAIKDTMSASLAQDKLLHEIEVHRGFAKYIKTQKENFSTEIKELEALIASVPGDSKTVPSPDGKKQEARGKVNTRLDSAKAALSLVNAAAGFQKKMLNALTGLSDAVVDVFGDLSGTLVI